ncbi:MAG TPA: hypothetical protein VK469_10635 [Candidatus Kapabacteria bacterium]|nr:hypothetical protein [Candidatus Kapabacteria bacterium]
MICYKNENSYEYKTVEFDLNEYIKKIEIGSNVPRSGIVILPHENWHNSRCIFMPETFIFFKWIKHKEGIKENISILDVKEKKIVDLRAATIWFPLVYLFSDVSIPIYLNMVANYLYDKFKGALGSDKCEIKLELLIENKCDKKTKKFSYEGSYHGFKEIVKRIDFDKMMEN